MEAIRRRLVVRTFDSYADTPLFSVAEFTGLAGYYFVGDVLGTIVFGIEERDPYDLYNRFATELQATYRRTGGHDPWVATSEEARAFINAHELRGFELSSSIGATAASARGMTGAGTVLRSLRLDSTLGVRESAF